MANFPPDSTPGNLWCKVPLKAFSYAWGTTDGFGEGMQSIQFHGGSICDSSTMANYPMVLSGGAGPMTPYLRGRSGWGGSLSGVLRTMLNVGSTVGHNVLGLVKAIIPFANR